MREPRPPSRQQSSKSPLLPCGPCPVTSFQGGPREKGTKGHFLVGTPGKRRLSQVAEVDVCRDESRRQWQPESGVRTMTVRLCGRPAGSPHTQVRPGQHPRNQGGLRKPRPQPLQAGEGSEALSQPGAAQGDLTTWHHVLSWADTERPLGTNSGELREGRTGPNTDTSIPAPRSWQQPPGDAGRRRPENLGVGSGSATLSLYLLCTSKPSLTWRFL